MSVELKVTLVGEDPQQQQAFNNPQTAIAPPAPPPSQPAQSASQPPPTPILAPPIIPKPPTAPTSSATSATAQPPIVQQPQQPSVTPQATASKPVQPPPLPSWFVQPPPVQGQDQRLILSLEHLIQVIDNLATTIVHQHTDMVDGRTLSRSQSQPRSTHSNASWFDRIADKIDKKIDDLGLAHTGVGDLVSGLSHNLAGFGTRVTKFASTALGGAGSAAGRQVATTAATTTAAASAGAATGAGAATAGAGTSAGASAGAAGALAAGGPLIAVALAAGAAALSLKMFMDAVHKTASELADVSAEIAFGQAKHEVSMELMRLDRAKRIGSDVAGIEHAQHRLSESMYELQTKIYELILKASPAIEGGIDMLNVIVRTLDVLISTANDIAAKITPDPTDDAPAAKALADSLQNLADAWDEMLHTHAGNNQNQMDPFLAELLLVDSNPGKPKRVPNRRNAMGGNP